MAGMTSAWGRFEELGAYLEKQEAGGKLNLEAIAKDLKWGPDIQKAMFGEGAISEGATVGAFRDFVLKTGGAAIARSNEALLEGGWLSQESATAYGEAGRSKSKAARGFAGRMAGAHGLLEAGDREGALAASRSAITDITSLRGREFTQAMGALSGAGITTTNELRELQRARESGGRITVGEMTRAFGEDWSKQMGLAPGQATKDMFEHSSTLQQKAVDYWAGQIVPTGSATDAGRKAPVQDQMAAVLKDLTTAITDMRTTGIKLNTEGGPIPVTSAVGTPKPVPSAPQSGVRPNPFAEEGP